MFQYKKLNTLNYVYELLDAKTMTMYLHLGTIIIIYMHILVSCPRVLLFKKLSCPVFVSVSYLCPMSVSMLPRPHFYSS